LENRVSDSVEKMGLPEPYTTVDEERVVALSRFLSDSHSGRMTELVTVTNYEILKGVSRVYIIEYFSLWQRLRGMGALTERIVLWLFRWRRSWSNSLHNERSRRTSQARGRVRVTCGWFFGNDREDELRGIKKVSESVPKSA
jgi:hypothetical protein